MEAIASPLMAEYIKFMYKTARKFWASVGVVTQEIQDIIGSLSSRKPSSTTPTW